MNQAPTPPMGYQPMALGCRSPVHAPLHLDPVHAWLALRGG
jgi:hypothetical protein